MKPSVSSGIHFDADYYRRFYLTRRTRAVSELETQQRAAVIASIITQLEVPVKRILDIGCGLGWLKAPLLQAFPKATYTGVEYSRYLCAQHGWRQGSVVDYVGRGRFDLVICCDVLQYLDNADAERAINNLARLSRGALFLHVPTQRDWQEVMDPSGTDARVQVRNGKWYQQRLRKQFQHVGNGVLIKHDVPVLQWELQSCWR